ncbi:hypothetical protein V7088_25125 [Priestia megaterium]|uniref:hypothetical protein n=1 Tax=Priestia megaterium TaxID=1404 RepID=UPI000BF30E44|nr:hypothetical protein [Priestia megaterium]PFP32636.1 hypothetical protein COK03_27440 [Priestia megaterium]
MRDNKDEYKQLTSSQKYTFMFICIAIIFIYVSYLVLLDDHTDFKDLYAAFCAILGGLIGGLITLEGVKRTVYAQREIESQKLVPIKLLNLYKLKKELKFFEDIKVKVDEWEWNLDYYAPPSNDDRSENAFTQLFKMIRDYKKIKKFAESSLEDKECLFIQMSSEIDIELYYEIVQLFEELNTKIKFLDEALQSVNFLIYNRDQKEVQDVVDLYKTFVRIEESDGVEKFDGPIFIDYMNRSDITPGQIVNTVRKAIPHLQDIYHCLDTGVSELNIMIEEMESVFKGNKQRSL